jgi:TatA/E family protein of Tat protein translocase
MGLFSPEKLLIVALLVAVVFGAKGVPGIARRAGKGIRETRDALGIDEIRGEITGVRDTLSPPPPAEAEAAPSDRPREAQ